jgi:hypothetical protein
MREFDAQYGRLDAVEPTVQSLFMRVPVILIPIHPLGTKSIRNSGIISHAYATVAKRSKIFCRIEGKTTDISEAADLPSAIRSTVGMGTVFNHPKSTKIGECEHSIQINRLSIKMDWQYRSCLFS